MACCRIVKVWDTATLNLQASLHGHMEEITDIDVSKCNRYLATASMSGQVILWDWQRCLKLEAFQDHTGTVNALKFFTLEDVQLLLSCSDDGTIRVVDALD